jgi:hypothetical protein
MLSDKSIVQFDPAMSSNLETGTGHWPLCRAAPADLLAGYPLRPGYNSDHFLQHLGDSRARYVIVRPDNIIYAISKDIDGLRKCLEELKAHFP